MKGGTPNSPNPKRFHSGAAATGSSVQASTVKRRTLASAAGETVASSSASTSAKKAALSNIIVASSSLPPSYSAAGATKARGDAHKLLQQNISFLSTKKQELQRHLALCLREHRTLTAAVRGAQERQRELHDNKAALHGQLLQMSMITSAMASVGRGTSSRGASARTASVATANSHHGPSSSGQEQQRAPFSFYAPQLAHHHQVELRDQQLSNHAGVADAARLEEEVVVTIQMSLSQKESAAVFEHSARLEALEDELRRGVQGAVAVHHELIAMERKAQHMVTLLDRAADAEVQVLHGAFPKPQHRVAATTTTVHSHHRDAAAVVDDEQQQQQQRLNVVFVNASPLYPSMTIDECPDLLIHMSSLCVTASEISLRLRRTIENGHVSAALTSQSLALQLSRGEKIAEAKHDEAELLHRAALHEEVRLKSKKSDLLEQLRRLQRRQDEIQHTLKLREALGVNTAAAAAAAVSSRGPSSSFTPVNADQSNSASPSPHPLLPLPFAQQHRGRSKSPSKAEVFRVPAGTVAQQAANSTRRGVSIANSLVASTDDACAVDAVVLLLSQERSLLELQASEIIAKIAHLDVTLKRVQLEKQHHLMDAEASTIRSAACVSLSPARSPAITTRSPERRLSPTTRTPRAAAAAAAA
jgi:hypothetical protein